MAFPPSVCNLFFKSTSARWLICMQNEFSSVTGENNTVGFLEIYFSFWRFPTEHTWHCFSGSYQPQWGKTEIMSSVDCSKLYKDESSPALPCSTCRDCKLLLQGTCGGALHGAGYPRKRSEALISCWATFSMTETNAASDQKGGGWVKDQLAINLKTQERQSNSIKKN